MKFQRFLCLKAKKSACVLFLLFPFAAVAGVHAAAGGAFAGCGGYANSASACDTVGGKVYAQSDLDVKAAYAYGEDIKAVYMRNALLEQGFRDFAGPATPLRVGFVVEKDGTLTGVRMLRHGSEEQDVAVLSMVRGMPAWHAGIKDGRAVRSACAIDIDVPVAFTGNSFPVAGLKPLPGGGCGSAFVDPSCCGASGLDGGFDLKRSLDVSADTVYRILGYKHKLGDADPGDFDAIAVQAGGKTVLTWRLDCGWDDFSRSWGDVSDRFCHTVPLAGGAVAAFFIGASVASQPEYLTVMVMKGGRASVVYSKPMTVSWIDSGGKTLYLQENVIEWMAEGKPSGSPIRHKMQVKDGALYYE